MNEGELKVAKQIYENQVRHLEHLYSSIGAKLSVSKEQLRQVQRRLDELEVKA
jgi:UDP-N-acetylglucosamine enolpyruvyl transferase